MTTLARALFGSARTEWETPADLFALLDREFSFTLDVCATWANRKCAAYFSRAKDGLRQGWFGTCWMNPPYGRAIAAWVKKAHREAGRGATIVCLLPARTDTVWWQDTVMKAREIRLLRGRITFVGATAPAPFPSAVAIFKNTHSRRIGPHVVAWNWRRRASAYLTGTSPRRAARPSTVAA
jgi:site-specific DNA-methyltransferase (adenine-specific)